MELPPDLRRALDAELGSLQSGRLAQATAGLSNRYRARKNETRRPLLQSQGDVQAYAAYRMPATFAAILAALSAVKELVPSWAPRNLLDLGAGPGTAAWAALQLWPSIQQITLIERDQHMIALGRRMAAESDVSALRQARWDTANMVEFADPGPADLVTAGYSLGELAGADLEALLQRLWNWTAGLLVAVEPGTPVGYSVVLQIRDEWIRRGGHVVAPCPHDNACPLAGHDWCHFSQRISRTRAHRDAKGGTLSYEDEKFSYAALGRIREEHISARVVRRPRVRTGLIELDLCTPDGMRRSLVSRREGGRFRQARELRWGSAISAPGTAAGEYDTESHQPT